MRYEQYAKQLIEDYEARGLADGRSIPDIDLYIDQMVSCLNSELAIYEENGKGPITKGMVSNYTKHRMIPGPEGKRYTRTHCLFMMLVFYLKGCFSMDQVERLMKPVLANYSSDWDDTMDIPAYYEEVLKLADSGAGSFEQDVASRIADIKKFLSDRGSDDDLSELLLLISALVIRSNRERFLAQKLLDEYFPDRK